MLPTPEVECAEDVYEPAEDTFLLIDALEGDLAFLAERTPGIALEIGAGSGCVSAFLARSLGPSLLSIATDINSSACRCTAATAARNKVSVHPLIADLAAPLRTRLAHAVDLILFNPPYVPTPLYDALHAQASRSLDAACAGGPAGMAITDRFLQHVADLMSPRAAFYLVAVAQNDIPAIRDRMLTQHHLPSDILLSRRAGREHLFVLRFVRTH